MVSANTYTSSYARALLATSRAEDLHKPDQLRKATGLTPDQMARLEREMAAINVDYKELEASYGDDMLVLVVASGYLERLLSKPPIERFLESRHPEFVENFRAIVQATSLDQPIGDEVSRAKCRGYRRNELRPSPNGFGGTVCGGSCLGSCRRRRSPPRQGRMRGSFPLASSRSATKPPRLTQLQQTFGAAQRRRGRQGSGSAEGAECVCRQQCNRRNCDARPCLGRSGSGSFSKGAAATLRCTSGAVPYDRTRPTSSSLADWPTLLHDVVHVTPRWQPQKAASESPNRSLSKRASLLARLGRRAECLFKSRRIGASLALHWSGVGPSHLSVSAACFPPAVRRRSNDG